MAYFSMQLTHIAKTQSEMVAWSCTAPFLWHVGFWHKSVTLE